MESVKKYLEQVQPDVLVLQVRHMRKCLVSKSRTDAASCIDPSVQEIKCIAKNFPTEQIQELGYHVLVEGQKTYNGVAILSKFRPELISTALYGGSEDPLEPQARYIEAKIADYHICNLYLPNGNPVNSMKFEYKLRYASPLKFLPLNPPDFALIFRGSRLKVDFCGFFSMRVLSVRVASSSLACVHNLHT